MEGLPACDECGCMTDAQQPVDKGLITAYLDALDNLPDRLYKKYERSREFLKISNDDGILYRYCQMCAEKLKRWPARLKREEEAYRKKFPESFNPVKEGDNDKITQFMELMEAGKCHEPTVIEPRGGRRRLAVMRRLLNAELNC